VASIANGISNKCGCEQPGSTPKDIMQTLSNVSLNKISWRPMERSKTGMSLLYTSSNTDSRRRDTQFGTCMQLCK